MNESGSDAQADSQTEAGVSALTRSDIEDLAARGISQEQAQHQLRRLLSGTRFSNLDRPATVGDGIEVLNPEQTSQRHRAFQRALARVTRFVPASGAASRMFKDLLQQLDSPTNAECATSERGCFFDQNWPFATALGRALEHGSARKEQLRFLLLGEPQMRGLARQPKALIPFHREGSQELTAFEEQILECLELTQLGALDEQHVTKLHFTVSPEHREAVAELEGALRQRLSSSQPIEISYSSQHSATDTLAVDQHNRPLREQTDTVDAPLILRPGGHGSLLKNLAELNGDLVMIKNIDNVQPKHRRSRTVSFKASLLGALVVCQDEVFTLIESLEDSAASAATIQHALDVLRRFGREPSERDAATLQHELSRPIRLCGVVRNQGEPGGGPFWVRDQSGKLSLQIVEGAQIDRRSTQQLAILNNATHFNPVDLACGLRDRHGEPFDLTQFRDDDTHFVASKSHNGQTIRALEHPGLWNGAMAHWLTLFVEAPSSTFSPVKTVWDLLRPEHRSALGRSDSTAT